MTLLQIINKLDIRQGILKRFGIGAMIGFLIISFFILSVNEPEPTWSTYWMMKPLILTPIISGLGALVFYLNGVFKPKRKSIQILINSLCLMFFLLILWIGVVLGLNGTLWD